MKRSYLTSLVLGLLCVSLIVSGSSSGGSSNIQPSVGITPTQLPDPPIVIEAGRCKKSFRRWFEFWIPADMTHHDVYFDFIDERTERPSRERIAKGFFQFGGQGDVMDQLYLYYIEDIVVWIPGGALDRSGNVSSSSCTVEDGPKTRDGTLDQIFQRYKETNWNQWHVVLKNCQHWADFVLDGTQPPSY